MSRGYKTVEQTVPALERIIKELRMSGAKALPSERALAKTTGTCQITLRKALFVLERRGFFVKTSRARLIDENGGKPAANVSVAYVSAGWDYPANPVWLRLGIALEREMRGIGADYRALYYGWKDVSETWPGGLAETPQIIILANTPNDIVRRNILSLRDKALIIAADEDYIGKCECVVALNNYNAGRMAAKMLIAAGAGRPAVIYCDKGYAPFYRRRDGFLDMIGESGLPVSNAAYLIRDDDLIPGLNDWAKQIETVCRNGHDGLFLFTDQGARRAREIIQTFYKVPSEFKLVTLDATGDCRNHNSPISSVSHGEEATAKKIAEIVCSYSRGISFDSVNLVDPEVLHVETV